MMKNLDELMLDLGLKTPPNELNLKGKEFILEFLNTEKEYRKQHKFKRLLRMSGIKNIKTFENFNWKFNPKIKKEDILEFKNSSWIESCHNLILIGDTGIGKSHIAKSLCYEAILEEQTTVFITAYDLISKLNKAPSITNKIEYYSKIKVLAIDEIGYIFHKKEDVDAIFNIISKRSEVSPTIITTNLSPKDWGTIFSGPAASAILDRLSYNGHFITFEGSSYRLSKKHKK